MFGRNKRSIHGGIVAHAASQPHHGGPAAVYLAAHPVRSRLMPLGSVDGDLLSTTFVWAARGATAPRTAVAMSASTLRCEGLPDGVVRVHDCPTRVNSATKNVDVSCGYLPRSVSYLCRIRACGKPTPLCKWR